MLGEITGIVGKNLVLQAAHLIEQLIFSKSLYHFGHATYIIILSQQILQFFVKSIHQFIIMAVHQFQQLLLAHRHEKLLEIHRKET
ncbi:Uncharacterised protein [Segatella copri]|nr:Uncharacterised protein [Segatella copri]